MTAPVSYGPVFSHGSKEELSRSVNLRKFYPIDEIKYTPGQSFLQSRQHDMAFVEGTESMRRSSHRLDADYSWGAQMSEVSRCGYDVVNGPQVLLLNRILAILSEASVFSVIAVVFGLYCFSAFLLSLCIFALNCHGDDKHGIQVHVIRMFLLCFRHLTSADNLWISFSSPSGAGDAPLQCLALGALGDFGSLILGATVIGFLATKMMTPHSQPIFTSRPAIIKRDGVAELTFRLAHPQGHVITGVLLGLTWVQMYKTREGESLKKFQDLPLNAYRTEIDIPLEIQHRIDEDSALYKYIDNFGKAPGFLVLSCRGTDSTLGCSCNGTYWYRLSDSVNVLRWVDAITRSKVRAVMEEARPAADLGLFDGVDLPKQPTSVTL